MSASGRHIRLACSAVVFVLLVLGTLIGDDDAFPFGPFRMYSTSTPPDGHVKVAYLQVRDGAGVWRRTGLNPGNVGVNRAEIEGQIPRLESDPGVLRTLADSHVRLHPAAEPWTGVRVWMQYLELEDRRYTGTREVLVAEWTAP